MQLALEAGKIVRIQPSSVADGLGAPFAGDWTLAMCQRYLDGMVLLDDPTILAGLRFALERMKQLLEPAGGAALAAVLAGLIPIRDGERVCVVASGGNVALERLGDLLAMAAPLADPAAAAGGPEPTVAPASPPKPSPARLATRRRRPVRVARPGHPDADPDPQRLALLRPARGADHRARRPGLHRRGAQRGPRDPGRDLGLDAARRAHRRHGRDRDRGRVSARHHAAILGGA